MMSHLAPLYQFDRNGNLNEKVGMPFSKYLRVIIIDFDIFGYFCWQKAINFVMQEFSYSLKKLVLGWKC